MSEVRRDGEAQRHRFMSYLRGNRMGACVRSGVKSNSAFVVNGTTARTVERLEMIKNCHQCEGVLRVWEIKCPYCHQSAMSWLHITVIVVLAAPVVFYMLNLI